jgi:hypothetical protein
MKSNSMSLAFIPKIEQHSLDDMPCSTGLYFIVKHDTFFTSYFISFYLNL